MNNALIKEAGDCLKLHSMALVGETLRTAQGIHPEFHNFSEIAVQLKNESGQWQPVQTENEDAPSFLVFRHVLAMRLLDEVTTDDDGNPLVLLEIQATYRVGYSVGDTVHSDEAISKFAEYNVPHHIWAFWREHVSTMVSKAGYPPVLLPLLRI